MERRILNAETLKESPDVYAELLNVNAIQHKIVQQAVVRILNQIYEVDFRGFSYGFCPGRSPHQALEALHVGISRKRVNWILDSTTHSSK